ncbi:MAG: DUF1489 family protein [Sphingobium sp.]|nr:DUF1489 family protein [Sphingobium sp.]
MPLHITKIAFGCDSVDDLREALEVESQGGEVRLTTRYCPKRVEEMEGGSLYWIHASAIVGRSPILGFMENGQGRYWLRIEPRLIPVVPRMKRAHQGWRYLAEADAPPDLTDGMSTGGAMPPMMAQELEKLGLI